MLAAFNAHGKTVLSNCAIEPEVKDLIKFLNKLGGKIKIVGRKIFITGRKKLKETLRTKLFLIELNSALI